MDFCVHLCKMFQMKMNAKQMIIMRKNIKGLVRTTMHLSTSRWGLLLPLPTTLFPKIKIMIATNMSTNPVESMIRNTKNLNLGQEMLVITTPSNSSPWTTKTPRADTQRTIKRAGRCRGRKSKVTVSKLPMKRVAINQ